MGLVVLKHQKLESLLFQIKIYLHFFMQLLELSVRLNQ